MTILGVLAGLLGAVVIAVGAQLQNRGVRAIGDDTTRSGFSAAQFLALVRTPRWLGGTGLVTLAILLQLVGLLLAPLPVVQPLGVLSLAVTALLDRRIGHLRLQRAGVVGIGLAVAGIAAFVTIAALVSRSTPDGVAPVVPVLVVEGAVLAAVMIAFVTARRHLPAVAFALAGGTCFGFVATLMKVVLDRCSQAIAQHGTLFDASAGFTVLVLLAAGAAGAIGGYLVQTAYSSESPDLVVAALTVVDPLVAVVLGVVLLGAARTAPVWAVAVAAPAAALAIAGVGLMAARPARPVDETAA